MANTVDLKKYPEITWKLYMDTFWNNAESNSTKSQLTPAQQEDINKTLYEYFEKNLPTFEKQRQEDINANTDRIYLDYTTLWPKDVNLSGNVKINLDNNGIPKITFPNAGNSYSAVGKSITTKDYNYVDYPSKYNVSTAKTATTAPDSPTTSPSTSLPVQGVTGSDVKQVEQNLKQNYPGEYAFWMSDPILKQIFESNLPTIEAMAQGSQTAATNFQRALQPYLEAKGSQALLAAQTQHTQPGTWAESLKNRSIAIQDAASKLGYQFDADTINSLAEKSLYQVYDPSQFNSQDGVDKTNTLLSNAAKSLNTQTPTGGAVFDARQQLASYNASQGSPYSGAWLDSAAADINDPSKGVSLQTYQDMIKNAAATKYSAFGDQIANKNVTVAQLADPYIQSYTKLLELPYDAGTATQYLNDPLVQKGLGASIDPTTGLSQPMPVWQFEQQVRQDPRWQQTVNAQDYYNNIVHQMGKDFGFVS